MRLGLVLKVVSRMLSCQMALVKIKNLLGRSSKHLQFCRNFNLPEYQSKILMNEYDLAVQDFRIASSVEEAERIVAGFKVR